MNLAFIGLGSMGASQAALLAQGDHELTVYDIDSAACAAFENSANVADSVATATKGADLIHVCVRDRVQTEAVLFGDTGVLNSAKSDALILLHSTLEVAAVQAAKEAASKAGVRLADVPVTRTRQESTAPFVMSMFGGSTEDFQTALPSLQIFSTDVLHVGDTGSAMALKIANNMMTWAQLVIGDITHRLAKSHDITWEHLATVTKANGNLTPTTEAFLSGAQLPREQRSSSHLAFIESQLGIGEKDLSLAIAAGQNAAIDMTVITELRSALRSAMLGAN